MQYQHPYLTMSQFIIISPSIFLYLYCCLSPSRSFSLSLSHNFSLCLSLSYNLSLSLTMSCSFSLSFYPYLSIYLTSCVFPSLTSIFFFSQVHVTPYQIQRTGRFSFLLVRRRKIKAVSVDINPQNRVYGKEEDLLKIS